MINALFPVLNWADGIFEDVVPLIVRLIVLGLICGAISILLYRLLSNQASIANLKREGRDIRGRLLKAEPGEFQSLVRRNTKVSLLLLARVFIPSLIAALPVIVVAAWAALHHNFDRPATEIAVHATPPQQHAVIRVGNETYQLPADGSPIEIPPRGGRMTLEIDGRPVFTGNPFDPPVGSVTKRLWWSVLIENPSGYIDESASIEELRFDFTTKKFLPGLPSIVAGWELPFFIAVFLSALALKFIMRVE
jgi:hypothetical protein